MGHQAGCRCPVCLSARGERTKKVPVGLRLRSDTIERLRACSAADGRSINEIVERAANEWLDRRERGMQGSSSNWVDVTLGIDDDPIVLNDDPETWGVDQAEATAAAERMAQAIREKFSVEVEVRHVVHSMYGEHDDIREWARARWTDFLEA